MQQFMPLFVFILVLWHFICDWLFQTHVEAMTKSHNRLVRYWHCFKYAFPFWPLLRFMGMHELYVAWSMTILFVSHYVIDSYVPVMLWAKWLRHAPEFNAIKWTPGQWEDKKIEARKVSDKEAFKAMASTPLGLILIITMDQFFHLCFLVPVAYFLMK